MASFSGTIFYCKHTHTHTYVYKQTRQGSRQAARQTKKQTEIDEHRQTDKTDRLKINKDIQTDGQADR